MKQNTFCYPGSVRYVLKTKNHHCYLIVGKYQIFNIEYGAKNVDEMMVFDIVVSVNTNLKVLFTVKS